MQKIPCQPEINIGTAGHVDHGKSTIVDAITGKWTSAHSEELRRGITIKVGYADAGFYQCKCEGPYNYSTQESCSKCKTKGKLQRVISFVDVPGHESLMANMLSGAALIDGAILIISANEEVPKPQTREHLLALQMLGTKQIVIVQNKVDLVSTKEAQNNYKKIKKFIKGTVAEKAPIIPISAQHGLNIDALISAIENNIKTPEKDKQSSPSLQVLRSFDINRPGISLNKLVGGVLGGSLSKGVFEVGDEIEIRPGFLNKKSDKYQSLFSKISSLSSSAGLMDKVYPSGLVAIGTDLDPSLTKSDSFVGSVVGHPNELPETYYSINVDLDLFDFAIGSTDMIKVEKLKRNEALRINSGTAVTAGMVTSVSNDKATIDLRRPITAEQKSRLSISRRLGDRWRLIGAGVIS